MKKNQPNIILIVMDAVRPDHLSCYGYHRNTSPNIDRLATQGVVYENAFSTAEWSYPSHASLFTGKYPSFHKTLGKDILLHQENVTIAEILRSKGYHSLGVSGNDLLSPLNGFDKGFHDYVVFDIPFKRSLQSLAQFLKRNPRNVLRTLISGLDGYTFLNIETMKQFVRTSEEPFFLFTNLYNCHAPYNPPRPFKKAFCPELQRLPLALLELVHYMLFTHPGGKLPGYNMRKLNQLADDHGQFAFIAQHLEASAEEWDVIKSWYDGEIRYLDQQLGHLIDLCKRQGVFDNTLWIICSDHGENFGDHNLASHQFCLYDSLLHIPLIMAYPEVIPPRTRITNLVSTIDILPTIAELVTVKPASNIQGKSLLPVQEQPIHAFICAESGESVRNHLVGWSPTLPPKLKAYDKGAKCLRTQTYKYILSADHTNELYNIQDDPMETNNIAEQHPDLIQHLKHQLAQTIDTSFFGPKAFPSRHREEILKRLQSMGYL
jgi:arylsulfatase A-like enzyme